MCANLLKMDYDACVKDYNQWNNETHATNATIVDGSYSSSEMENKTLGEACHRPITSVPDEYMQHQWAVLWWGTMIMSWYVLYTLQHAISQLQQTALMQIY
jgi:hypothetical protein